MDPLWQILYYVLFEYPIQNAHLWQTAENTSILRLSLDKQSWKMLEPK